MVVLHNNREVQYINDFLTHFNVSCFKVGQLLFNNILEKIHPVNEIVA